MARCTRRGFRLLEHRVREAQPGQAADAVVLHEHVRAREEPAQHLAPGLRLEVQAQASLVAVDREVVGRLARVAGNSARVALGIRQRPASGCAGERRSPGARAVALGRLDLDHVGAEVGQQHRAVGPGEHGREVAHDDAREWSGRGVAHTRLRYRSRPSSPRSYHRAMADDLTLLTVHAHPDDETISTGGVMARYAAEGHAGRLRDVHRRRAR